MVLAPGKCDVFSGAEPGPGMICCFDIGGSFIKYGVPGSDGLVSELGRIPTPTESFDLFVEALQRAIAEMGGAESAAISISITGFIHPRTGQAGVANVPCVNGRLLEKDLTERLGCPVLVTNDADCFALAEARTGLGQGHDIVFAIILGTGVGGGLVINGQLVRGQDGISGEWGHGPIVDPGAGGLIDPLPRIQCGCGRTDCLDGVGGARGLERLYAAMHGETLDSTVILRRWRNGEIAADKTVEVCVEHLARALCIIVNVVGAELVPVGGGLATATDLIERLDTRVRELVLADYPDRLVVSGQHVGAGGLIGAALVAANREGVVA